MADGMDTMKTGRGIQPVVDNPKLPLMSDEPPRAEDDQGQDPADGRGAEGRHGQDEPDAGVPQGGRRRANRRRVPTRRRRT